MPTLLSQLILSLEITCLLGGCILLWRHGLSPAARTEASDRAAAMPAWPLSVPNFLLFLWLVIFGGIVVQGLTALGLKHYSVGDQTSLIIAGGAFQIGMLLGIVLFKTFSDKKAARPDHSLKWGQICRYGLVTVLIALPVLSLVSLTWQYVLHLCGIAISEQELVGIFADTKSPGLLALMILLATVVAPVTEELLFRGGIFRYARTRMPRWVALLGSALVFASLHGNLASFAPLLVLGIILSLAYERTGNIAVSIIAHGLFNLNTILLIFAGIGL